jgi:hypothetical protein
MSNGLISLLSVSPSGSLSSTIISTMSGARLARDSWTLVKWPHRCCERPGGGGYAVYQQGQAPILLVESAEADGRKVQLCDFATAGEGGAEYATWFKVDNVPAAPFSQAPAFRSGGP